MANANGLSGIAFFCLKGRHADTLAGGDAKGRDEGGRRGSAPAAAGRAEFERMLLDLIEAEALRAEDPKRALELAGGALGQLTYMDPTRHRIQARLLAADLYREQGRTGDASAALLLAVKRCRLRLTCYLRTLSEAMARYGIEEGVSRNQTRAVGWRPDEALSGYFLREELGAGSFGTVYRALTSSAGATSR